MDPIAQIEVSRRRGRPEKLGPDQEAALLVAYGNPKLSPEEVARMFNISRATLYSIVARHRRAREGTEAQPAQAEPPDSDGPVRETSGRHENSTPVAQRVRGSADSEEAGAG